MIIPKTPLKSSQLVGKKMLNIIFEKLYFENSTLECRLKRLAILIIEKSN